MHAGDGLGHLCEQDIDAEDKSKTSITCSVAFSLARVFCCGAVQTPLVKQTIHESCVSPSLPRLIVTESGTGTAVIRALAHDGPGRKIPF